MYFVLCLFGFRVCRFDLLLIPVLDYLVCDLMDTMFVLLLLVLFWLLYVVVLMICICCELIGFNLYAARGSLIVVVYSICV